MGRSVEAAGEEGGERRTVNGLSPPRFAFSRVRPFRSLRPRRAPGGSPWPVHRIGEV